MQHHRFILAFRAVTGELFPTFSPHRCHSIAERMSDFVTVAKVGDIPEGQGQAFNVGGRMVAVFNTGEGYSAIDDFCPHMGASLAGGPIDDGCVVCPWHAWAFQLSDGAWLDNPRIKVDCFEVRVVDDEIQVLAKPKTN